VEPVEPLRVEGVGGRGFGTTGKPGEIEFFRVLLPELELEFAREFLREFLRESGKIVPTFEVVGGNMAGSFPAEFLAGDFRELGRSPPVVERKEGRLSSSKLRCLVRVLLFSTTQTGTFSSLAESGQVMTIGEEEESEVVFASGVEDLFPANLLGSHLNARKKLAVSTRGSFLGNFSDFVLFFSTNFCNFSNLDINNLEMQSFTNF